MTVMDEMTAFASARLDEDEAAARADPEYVAWLSYRDGGNGIAIYHTTVAARHGDWEPWCAAGRELDTPSSARIVYDPARVLREVKAAREIVRLHGPMSIYKGHPMFNDAHLTSEPMRLCRSCEPETMWRRENSWPCRTLRTLVAIWEDHPDYKAEQWKP